MTYRDNTDDRRIVPGKTGSQDGNPAGDASMTDSRTGYDVVRRTEPGRFNDGPGEDIKGSFEGMKYYRPRGR